MLSFVSGNSLTKIAGALIFCAVATIAAVDAEMEGMEVDQRDDGTFLVGSPTFYFDRALGGGGLHSESELWSPSKIRQRLLFSREITRHCHG